MQSIEFVPPTSLPRITRHLLDNIQQHTSSFFHCTSHAITLSHDSIQIIQMHKLLPSFGQYQNNATIYISLHKSESK